MEERKRAAIAATATILIVTVAACVGYTNFKSVNVNALIISIGMVAAVVAGVAYLVGLWNKKPIWADVFKYNFMTAAGSACYVFLELLHPTL